MAVKVFRTVQAKDRYGDNCTIDARTEMYGSAAEVVRDCRHRPVRIEEYDMSHRHIVKDWFGVNSYDEALDLLASGYQPVVEALKDTMKIHTGEGTRFSFKNDITGFVPVIPLVLSGVPKCMVNIKMKPIKSKVIDIYYDMTAHCGHNPEEFVKAGQVVLSAIMALEQQGYKFNLYALQSFAGNSRTADLLCVKVKSSDRPLDIKRLSFPLTHPAFFRVIGFDWQGKSPVTRDIGSGRGQSLSQRYGREVAEQVAKSLYGKNAFYLSCTDLIDRHYDKETLKEVLVNVKNT